MDDLPIEPSRTGVAAGPRRSLDRAGDPSPVRAAGPPSPAYEELLGRDPTWALSEGSRHFDEKSAVFDALTKIARRLKALEIPYAIVGGMALFRHGLRRFTEAVDILVTREGLKAIHEGLDGLGYLPPHRNSKHLRDTESGVRIKFLTTGGHRGDGKANPVAFPDPSRVGVDFDGVNCLNLEALIELKLASGMTSPGRLKDLSDVLELIKVRELPEDFSGRLHPYVAGKFRELWGEARRRFVAPLRPGWLAAEAATIEELIAARRGAADELEAMRRDGVTLDVEAGPGHDHARLVTTDPAVARRYGMIEESEYWGRDDEGPAGDGTEGRADTEGTSDARSGGD